MAEPTVEPQATETDEVPAVSEYTTQTGDTRPGDTQNRPAAATRRPVVTGNALGTGRR